MKSGRVVIDHLPRERIFTFGIVAVLRDDEATLRFTAEVNIDRVVVRRNDPWRDTLQTQRSMRSVLSVGTHRFQRSGFDSMYLFIRHDIRPVFETEC